MTQLSLPEPLTPIVKQKPISERRKKKFYRRLFWTAMKHPKIEPQRIKDTPIEGIMMRTNYRLALCIPGWYSMGWRVPDFHDWMWARRNRLWKLVKGYEAKGNTDKADFYYRLYQEHTYHL